MIFICKKYNSHALFYEVSSKVNSRVFNLLETTSANTVIEDISAEIQKRFVSQLTK
jgi:hypothetical protein